METVLVMGAGHQGLAMAAHLTLNGVSCNLWNRSEQNIHKIKESGYIQCDGFIQGEARINKVSREIEGMLKRLIMVTTPASAHVDIARVLAPHVNQQHVIILNPGRTCGALEFKKSLIEAGCTSIPIIAETQTIVYTCRALSQNSVMIYAMKHEVGIAALDSERTKEVMDVLPECLKDYFVPMESWGYTSFGNVGMILHCAPMIMNVGWIESAAAEFKYYYDGITPSIARILEQMDLERIATARSLGYGVESVYEWLQRSYGVKGSNLYESLQNNTFYRNIDAPNIIQHRYLEEDIPCGLVPIESAAGMMGIHTKAISTIIDMAGLLMEKDYRKIGRDYQKLSNYL